MDYQTRLNKLKEMLLDGNVVFFGGAGVSTESGIPDFRSADGLYSHTPEELVSHTFFKYHTEEFYEFYKGKMLFPEAKPNACHIALAKLEKEGLLEGVITQNIDGLHQKAGSKRVYELHGSVWRNYCLKCGKGYTVYEVMKVNGVPYCQCGGLIKPDVVLYEEGLDDEVVMGAINAIANAKTLIVGGTSLIVYPAAGLLRYFRGTNLVVINRSATKMDGMANLLFTEDIGKVFEDLKIIE